MKNNDLKGIIVVDKAKDYTSHDCVAILRRKLKIKRIGHTGTLDPMATGVLPICVGSATRLMDYTDWDLKEYICRLRFGIETDTLDIWGEVLREEPLAINMTKEEIIGILQSFLGEQSQIPPKYSAIKVDGKKLYEYARAGKEVKIKARKVFFKKIDLLDMRLKDGYLHEMDILVSCSKGTYIRSLCKDIGDKLGNVAVMSYLDRVKSGSLSKEMSINIETIKEMSQEEIEKLLIPTDSSLLHLVKIVVDLNLGKDFVNGKKIPLEKIENLIEHNKENSCNVIENSDKLGEFKDFVRVYYKDDFLGIGKIENSYFKADKVFDVRIQNESF